MSQTFEPARSADGRPRSRGGPDHRAVQPPGGARLPMQATQGGGPDDVRAVPDLERTRLLPGAGMHRGDLAAAGRPEPAERPVDLTERDALAFALVGARPTDDEQAAGWGHDGPDGVRAAGQPGPRASLWDRPVVPPAGSAPGDRGSRRSVVQANASSDGDDRSRRRTGSGPAAARALGSKIVPDGAGGGSGRGNDRMRPAGGRRYLPVPPEEPAEAPDDTATGQIPPVPGPFAVANSGADVAGVPPYGLPPEPGAWQEPATPSITAAFGSHLGDPFGDTGATQIVRPVGYGDQWPDYGQKYGPDYGDRAGYDGYGDDAEAPAAEGPAASLVRPYARTGGRTKPGHELDLEALVATTVNGREAWSSPLLNPEHVQVIGLCMDTTSVAEVAARLSVPIGVARVIIADMVDLGLVEVGKTSANNGDERDPAFLRRVLSGLQRL